MSTKLINALETIKEEMISNNAEIIRLKREVKAAEALVTDYGRKFTDFHYDVCATLGYDEDTPADEFPSNYDIIMEIKKLKATNAMLSKIVVESENDIINRKINAETPYLGTLITEIGNLLGLEGGFGGAWGTDNIKECIEILQEEYENEIERNGDLERNNTQLKLKIRGLQIALASEKAKESKLIFGCKKKRIDDDDEDDLIFFRDLH